ncbi:MAG: sugar isomerase domain-containing protein [Phycisphaerales bacterium]|nr:sugar isomerase domain-containing protein [Phycisphaerales bacterium]
MSPHPDFPAGIGIDAYFKAIAETQERVYQTQRPTLLKLAEKMAEVVLNRGRIYVFGTGHSHMLAEEGYARAGGLQSVVPIFYTALMLHESIPMEAKVERTPGLANDLLDRAGIRSGELLFIYSNSGVNHLPVEMALEAKKRGIVTATIGSQVFAKVAPLSNLGRRLAEICDFALDNGGVAGDGMIAIPGQEWKAGPSSTVIGALLWNSLVVETCMRLQVAVGDAPIGVSFNMPGRERAKQRDGDKTFNLAPKHL